MLHVHFQGTQAVPSQFCCEKLRASWLWQLKYILFNHDIYFSQMALKALTGRLFWKQYLEIDIRFLHVNIFSVTCCYIYYSIYMVHRNTLKRNYTRCSSRWVQDRSKRQLAIHSSTCSSLPPSTDLEHCLNTDFTNDNII